MPIAAILNAVKAKRLDCSCYAQKDVRECVFDGHQDRLCPLYPLRLGEKPKKFGRTIRGVTTYCLECCNEQEEEVTLCPVTDCDLYTFRLGKAPRPKAKGRQVCPKRI